MTSKEKNDDPPSTKRSVEMKLRWREIYRFVSVEKRETQLLQCRTNRQELKRNTISAAAAFPWGKSSRVSKRRDAIAPTFGKSKRISETYGVLEVRRCNCERNGRGAHDPSVHDRYAANVQGCGSTSQNPHQMEFPTVSAITANELHHAALPVTFDKQNNIVTPLYVYEVQHLTHLTQNAKWLQVLFKTKLTDNTKQVG